MANLYRVVYRTNTDQVTSAVVIASTDQNAWAAVQSSDSTAMAVESMDEMNANVIVGS